MRRLFDEAAEQEFREAFIESRRGTRSAKVYLVRSCIRCSCLAFREAFPADSILNHTHTIEWVAAWNARQSGCSVATRQYKLTMLGAWWRWLFERHVIDDNVLSFVSCVQLARDAVPLLTLRCNLQRHIGNYLESRSELAARTREMYDSWLKRFNVFINTSPDLPRTLDPDIALGEEGLAAWFRSVCSSNPRQTVMRVAGLLSAFSDFLMSKGVLTDNALSRLEQAFPLGKLVGVACALAADDRTGALHALAPPPRFRSHFADRIAGFLDLKRAVGCHERYGFTILRDFDQFLVTHGEEGPITSALLLRWRDSRPALGRSSRRGRWIVIRQFCRYVQRYVPETYVPDPIMGWMPRTTFRPRIVLPDEMKTLLGAVADVCPGARWSLRPHTYRALLVLLYTTGLRISEALHLRVNDVDLCERVLVVRETKFYKSRFVPFSDGLLAVIRDYQRERLHLLGPPARDAPFFPAKHGGHYAKSSINDVWQDLLRHTGLRGDTGRNPRVHDLRHSFATLRLAAWYREGADVESMLPLLATYLGHASVAGTYHYLTILPETLLAASEQFRRYSGAIITPTGGSHALA